MSQYIVTFTGHVKRDRPDTMPAEIHEQEFIEADTKEQVIDAVGQLTMKYIRHQGMAVFLDPAAIQDISKINTDKMFVPMHMLTRITAKAQLLSLPLPLIGLDGVVVHEEGEEVQTQ